MLFEIFKFEIKYRAKRWETYLYFAVLFLFSIIAVDFIAEGQLDPLKRNAPYVIARTMGVVSALFMIITSMVMGVAVLRDFDHQMESLMFINPIKKRDYLLGRFFGSFIVLIFIFSGLLFGMMLGDFMPWLNADNRLPFNFWHYLHPFLFLIIPTLFFGGALFFVSGTLSRKLIVVYTQGVLFLIVYILAMNLAENSEDLFLSALLEPFTFQSVSVTTQFWTVAERNSQMLSIEGILLYNRLIWLAVGIIALVIGHYGFSFNAVRDKASKSKKTLKASALFSSSDDLSDVGQLMIKNTRHIKIPTFTLQTGIRTSFQQLKQQTVFYVKTIIKEIPFWAIVICGAAIIMINSISLGTVHGVDSYPATYIIVGELQELSILFFLLIILFYSGELVWKERDAKISKIFDALPVSDFVNLTGKFIALAFIIVLLILAIIVASVIFQTSKAYYHYEPGVYFTGFFVEIFPFLILLMFVCFFFQVLINHKFLAHLAVMGFTFISTILLQVLGLNHGLYTFGASNLGTYSDMNGYGHFLKPYLWFKVYWIAFSVLLFIIAVLFSVRGTEVRIKQRWKLSKFRLTKPLRQLGTVALLIFILSGVYIFYNTNILNSYSTQTRQETFRADYEKALKQYEHYPQPKIIDVNLKLDLYPSDRNYSAEGYFILTNTHDIPIDKIHIQKQPNELVSIEYLHFEEGARLNNKYKKYGYHIYDLNEALQPGDSIKMKFKQTYTTKGFTEYSDPSLVYNGTLLNHLQFPTLAYNEHIELEDDNTREQYGLAPKIRTAKLNDSIATLEGRSGGDGEEINFEIVIGTDSCQTAIAPGYLQKKWIANDRKYFHYKMDKPMSNFYSVLSAQYEVMQDQWQPSPDCLSTPVQLEIYYHKGHEYNLQRMMTGMKKSLEYFSKNFSPYQYRQMRIVETPSYKSRAVSFPNTVPFSENIGFIMDIDDEKDVDMAFYITAHELAHQWWGHQVTPANVQGKAMLTEALAQYSALMVVQQTYSEEMVGQILQAEMSRYLKGRTNEKTQEMSLSLVESGQQYIHYGKGLINLYAFQDYISEDSVNMALSRFIRDWDSFNGLLKTKTDRYATSADLLGYFREVTPDSLQYIIEDLFETITVYENRTIEAEYEKFSKDQYKVDLTLDAKKYRLDSQEIETSIGINDWIDIGVYTENEDGKEELIYLKKHKITNQLTKLEIWVDQKPVKAGIDIKNKLTDRNFSDNVKVLSKKK